MADFHDLAIHGRLLAIRGKSDSEIAESLGVSLGSLAVLAWESEEVFLGITPTDAERTKWAKRREVRRKTKANRNNREKACPSARIRNSTRARIWAALNGRSDGKLFTRLGYTADELVTHLSARLNDGMTWENYGKWHVDHIRPCASFDQSDPAQFAECWALSNLQPLWAADNYAKGAKCLN